MSATQDLIAAALMLADELDELHKEGRNPATFTPSTVREMCARAMVEPDGWRPIETAPKDAGVLLYCRRLGAVCGVWSDEKYAKKPRPYWRHDRTHLFGIRETRDDQPTHWMPLPGAPK